MEINLAFPGYIMRPDIFPCILSHTDINKEHGYIPVSSTLHF